MKLARHNPHKRCKSDCERRPTCHVLYCTIALQARNETAQQCALSKAKVKCISPLPVATHDQAVCGDRNPRFPAFQVTTLFTNCFVQHITSGNNEGRAWQCGPYACQQHRNTTLKPATPGEIPLRYSHAQRNGNMGGSAVSNHLPRGKYRGRHLR